MQGIKIDGDICVFCFKLKIFPVTLAKYSVPYRVRYAKEERQRIRESRCRKETNKCGQVRTRKRSTPTYASTWDHGNWTCGSKPRKPLGITYYSAFQKLTKHIRKHRTLHTIAEDIDGGGLVAASQAALVATAIHGNVLLVVGLELGHAGQNVLHATLLAHSLNKKSKGQKGLCECRVQNMQVFG